LTRIDMDKPLTPRPFTASVRLPATDEMVPLLRALADETRLKIFALLTREELCVCEIEDVLGLPQSLVSNHLAVLRRAGLVRWRRDAEDSRWIFYRADPGATAALRHRCSELLTLRAPSGGGRRAEEVCRARR
jgi:DNA-binding transcriptional ArsR family regulator